MKGVDIYMKSGNVINLTNVEDLNIEYSGDLITKFSLKYSDTTTNFKRLLVESINLSQIEAITWEEI